jgi:hypothetical protein
MGKTYFYRKQTNAEKLEHRAGLWLRRIKFWREHRHLFENHRVKRKQVQNPEWGSW